MKRTKSNNKFHGNDSALSTVVGAVLVLGLLVTLTTTIQVSYVPAWKADAEYSHMSDVWRDMTSLKSNIDILSAGLLISPDFNSMISVPIEMGGGDIPIIAAGKSSGMLSINSKNCSMMVVANNISGAVIYDSSSDLLQLGSISYSSNNNYYIDQMFEYENGALIVVQNERSLMKLSPAITVNRLDATNISMVVSAVELIGDKRTKSSNTIEEIYLKSNTSSLLFSSSALVSDVSIIMSTNYPTAWAQYFNSTAKRVDLVYGTDYSTTVDGTNVTFILTGSAGEDIQLHVQKVTIDALVDVI
ncbi:MAG: hypothetical protein P1P69_00970 [Methanosarcinaceae archaeon]|nr:hypothetical protein [Methanosarcinaceae archaeon]MDF1533060.1 hypothetical protein [Methanosarcinaceae archaeon]